MGVPEIRLKNLPWKRKYVGVSRTGTLVKMDLTSKLTRRSSGSMVRSEMSWMKCVELKTWDEVLPVCSFKRLDSNLEIV